MNQNNGGSAQTSSLTAAKWVAAAPRKPKAREIPEGIAHCRRLALPRSAFRRLASGACWRLQVFHGYIALKG